MIFPTALFYVCLSGLLAFPLLWVLASRAFARKSGWHDLASSFAEANAPRLEEVERVSAKVGNVNYQNAVRVQETDSGLRLQMHTLLRFGHPALLIPWSDVKVLEVSPSSDTLSLELGQQKLQVQLPQGVLDKALTQRVLP